MTINFYSKLKGSLPFKQKWLAQIINKAVSQLKIKKELEITVLLVGDKEIRTLNKKYRQQDKVTDVLSFSQQEGLALVLPEPAQRYLGDIVISYPQVRRQAKLFRHSLAEEFSLLLIHGFLHLLGYDDDTRAHYLKMHKLQEKILSKICLN